MNDNLLANYLETAVAMRPSLRASWPIDFSLLTNMQFTPFGPVVGPLILGAEFNTGWFFTYDGPAGGQPPEIMAMFTGLLHWRADTGQGPGLLLESFNYPAEMLNVVRPEIPGWLPKCKYVEYSHLDLDGVREAVAAIVDGLEWDALANLEAAIPELAGASSDQIARWFSGELHNGAELHISIPIGVGTAIGRGADIGAGRKTLLVRLLEKQAAAFYLNPGYYAHFLSEAGYLDTDDVADATLRSELLQARPPLIGSGTIRRVSKNAAPPAFQSVRSAVDSAGDGDLILIEDQDTYQAASVINIQKPLVIMGSTSGNATDDPPPDFPVLKGSKPTNVPRGNPSWAQNAHGVLKMSNIDEGAVQLAALHVQDGADRQGGGVYADDCHRIWIENTIFTGNEAYAGGWLFEGFGGAIATRHAGIVVKGCAFRANRANCRGGAIGIFGYGWPIISGCTFHDNHALRLNITNAQRGRAFKERPDGGAIGIQMATPNDEQGFGRIGAVAEEFRNLESYPALFQKANQLHNQGHLTNDDLALLKNLWSGTIDEYWHQDDLEASRANAVLLAGNSFTNNTAQDDGGAIYATGLVKARCLNNLISGNQAGSNGGGIRISTACDFVVDGGQIVANQSNSAKTGYSCQKKDGEWKYVWTTNAGGGIASRTSNLVLRNVQITANLAHRFAGGGVFFTSTDDGALPIPISGMSTTWNVIRDRLVKNRAGQPNPEFFSFDLVIDSCTITNNCCGWCLGTTEIPPGPQNPGNHCTSPAPTNSDQRDVTHAKGGGVYVLRYSEETTSFGVTKTSEFPPIHVSIRANTTLTANTAVFSNSARELFITDLTRLAPNNPIKDSDDLDRDSVGLVQTGFEYPEVTP
jgi:predicted outer membrane repeat protein